MVMGAYFQNCRHAATFLLNPYTVCKVALRFTLRLASVKKLQKRVIRNETSRPPNRNAECHTQPRKLRVADFFGEGWAMQKHLTMQGSKQKLDKIQGK